MKTPHIDVRILGAFVLVGLCASPSAAVGSVRVTAARSCSVYALNTAPGAYPAIVQLSETHTNCAVAQGIGRAIQRFSSTHPSTEIGPQPRTVGSLQGKVFHCSYRHRELNGNSLGKGVRCTSDAALVTFNATP